MWCIECQAKSVEVEDIDVQDSTITVSKYCRDCRTEWLDYFDLMDTEVFVVRGTEV